MERNDRTTQTTPAIAYLPTRNNLDNHVLLKRLINPALIRRSREEFRAAPHKKTHMLNNQIILKPAKKLVK